jgi:hypothetical protein
MADEVETTITPEGASRAGRGLRVTNVPGATVLTIHARRVQPAIFANPFHEWVFSNGTVWTQFHRAVDSYLLRFPGLADFTVSAGGTDVAAYPVPDVSEQTIEHLYLSQVFPLAMSRQWKLVLHASAVEVEGAAVAFLGASGRGKSTLTASFATSGYRFLTDDGLQLEKSSNGYLIQPSHPSIRLWDDSRWALIPSSARMVSPVDYTPKARLLADDEVSFCDAARPLRCLYVLGKQNMNALAIEPVSGRDAMIELVRNSFLLDIEEREMLAHHFGQLSALAALPMIFRLDYPRQFAALPAVRDAVTQHARTVRATVQP